MKRLAFLALALGSFALGPSPPGSCHVVETRTILPLAWTQESRQASPQHDFGLLIGLRQKNLHWLEEELLTVPDSTSAAE